MNEIHPNPPELTLGELVRITIEARVAGNEQNHRKFLVPTADPAELPFGLWLAHGMPVKIERVAPAQWPPRRGDVWVDPDGEEYFGVLHKETGKINLAPNLGTGVFHDPAWVLEKHGPLTLDRRRDWTRSTAELPLVPADPPVVTGRAALGGQSTQDLADDEPEALLASGAVGHAGDELGNDCPTEPGGESVEDTAAADGSVSERAWPQDDPDRRFAGWLVGRDTPRLDVRPPAEPTGPDGTHGGDGGV